VIWRWSLPVVAAFAFTGCYSDRQRQEDDDRAAATFDHAMEYALTHADLRGAKLSYGPDSAESIGTAVVAECEPSINAAADAMTDRLRAGLRGPDADFLATEKRSDYYESIRTKVWRRAVAAAVTERARPEPAPAQ